MAESSTTVRHSHEIPLPAREAMIQLLDSTIMQISGRDLVSTSEMTDLLLDIRLHLMLSEHLEVV